MMLPKPFMPLNLSLSVLEWSDAFSFDVRPILLVYQSSYGDLLVQFSDHRPPSELRAHVCRLLGERITTAIFRLGTRYLVNIHHLNDHPI